MIRVLQDWEEIGNSILTLQKAGVPTHETPQKNWDHLLLYNSLAGTDKRAMIADLGCGDGHTLSLLHTLGFKNIHGVDFRIGWHVRAKQIVTMYREMSLKRPFNLHKGDISQTSFDASTCDVAISISTIEHGVNLESFLTEAHRILKPNGKLFITTDYWEDKIETKNCARAFGLSWQIFCRDQIESLIEEARGIGFKLSENSGIPSCVNKTVRWHKAEYTFIALLLRKT